MLDWIFEGIATWVASVMTQIMDAISGVFIGALGTDMTAMEEYFPFAVSAYTIIQYTAWALLLSLSAGRYFWIPNRLCKTHLQSCPGHRAGALHGTHGLHTGSR